MSCPWTQNIKVLNKNKTLFCVSLITTPKKKKNPSKTMMQQTIPKQHNILQFINRKIITSKHGLIKSNTCLQHVKLTSEEIHSQLHLDCGKMFLHLKNIVPNYNPVVPEFFFFFQLKFTALFIFKKTTVFCNIWLDQH